VWGAATLSGSGTVTSPTAPLQPVVHRCGGDPGVSSACRGRQLRWALAKMLRLRSGRCSAVRCWQVLASARGLQSAVRFDPAVTGPVPWIGHGAGLSAIAVCSRQTFHALRACRRRRGSTVASRSRLTRRCTPSIGRELRHEAHVPAEQPQAAQDARLPLAHAHACWPGHSRRTSAQGARPPRSLRRPTSGSR
jgi:hypothetical protein